MNRRTKFARRVWRRLAVGRRTGPVVAHVPPVSLPPSWFVHQHARATRSILASPVVEEVQHTTNGRKSQPFTAGAPKVSCLMVTRGTEAHVRRSISAFLGQSYPRRELVVVTTNGSDSLRSLMDQFNSPTIGFFVHDDPDATLGDLRNLSVEKATGDLVCQWDDDDLHDRDRIRLQTKALTRTGADACMLQRLMIWWPGQSRLAVSEYRFWEGTLLARREVMPRYPTLKIAEDTPVIDALREKTRIAMIDLPMLYTYVCHGANSWDAAHFALYWQNATSRYSGKRHDYALRALQRRCPDAAGIST